MFGHRGIWKDGWMAVARHEKGAAYEDDPWELYRIADDYSESRNLAEERPDVLQELVDTWWQEAERNGVLPLDDRTTELFSTPRRPGTPHTGRRYVYYPPITHMPSDAAPRLSGKRPWTATLEVERNPGGGNGVLVARGSHNLGFVLYVKDDHLVFDYNVFATHYRVVSEPIATDARTVELRYAPRGAGAEITLQVDGREVGRGTAAQSVRMMGSTGMDVGRDALSPVSDEYDAPFPFDGTIHRVTFELLPVEAAVERREAQEEANVDLARE
jgi:arylsulfatase